MPLRTPTARRPGACCRTWLGAWTPPSPPSTACWSSRPGLVRVRLELGRAFFLKGEDSLASQPPPAVAANVVRFLSEIWARRARRRWNMHLGAALAPDTNIGFTSDEEIIYIHGLPFRRDVDDRTTSGVGVSVWTGGEYQHRLDDRLRLRIGGGLSRRDYAGGEFDQLFVSGHVGPRWLAGENTEVSLLGQCSAPLERQRIRSS